MASPSSPSLRRGTFSNARTERLDREYRLPTLNSRLPTCTPRYTDRYAHTNWPADRWRAACACARARPSDPFTRRTERTRQFVPAISISWSATSFLAVRSNDSLRYSETLAFTLEREGNLVVDDETILVGSSREKTRAEEWEKAQEFSRCLGAQSPRRTLYEELRCEVRRLAHFISITIHFLSTSWMWRSSARTRHRFSWLSSTSCVSAAAMVQS